MTAIRTLISTGDLEAHLGDPDWTIIDCRFNLADPWQGAREYEALHIAGAVYAHIDNDLSGPVVHGVTGRHPLPSIEAATATFSRLGIGPGTQVVAYDERTGAFAGRLWWLLRWLGHEDVAVLDGGWNAWQREGRLVRSGIETRAPRTFVARPRPELIVEAAAVDRQRLDPAYRVLDSRTAERYRGENETIDPVAGHIPGAFSSPYADNVDAEGHFLDPQVLRRRFEALLGDVVAERAVFYCGSGVTAAQNVLALAHAGLGEARLYPGSWSEWITDPDRPVATGAQP
jgi:thiosulfate/3-mercaptopyruvate sulfurtransferase